MRGLYEKFQPEVANILEMIGNEIGTDREAQAINNLYPQLPKLSIDYDIFEKLDGENTVIIPADLGWTDAGTWQLLFQGLTKNPETDNLIKGEVELIETKRSLVYSNVKGKLISVIGLNDICVVDTEDGLIVCDLKRSDEVKKLVDSLESKKLNNYL